MPCLHDRYLSFMSGTEQQENEANKGINDMDREFQELMQYLILFQGSHR